MSTPQRLNSKFMEGVIQEDTLVSMVMDHINILEHRLEVQYFT
jgi:hypothetical protein